MGRKGGYRLFLFRCRVSRNTTGFQSEFTATRPVTTWKMGEDPSPKGTKGLYEKTRKTPTSATSQSFPATDVVDSRKPHSTAQDRTPYRPLPGTLGGRTRRYPPGQSVVVSGYPSVTVRGTFHTRTYSLGRPERSCTLGELPSQ